MAHQRIEELRNSIGYKDINTKRCLDKKRLMFGGLFNHYEGRYKAEQWTIEKAEVEKLINILTENRSAKPGNTPAGFTYLGQMITHEIVESTVKTEHDRKEVSPLLNLDSIYPEFKIALDEGYLKQDSGEFILGSDSTSEGSENDLYRPDNRGGRPLIPERRNDENVIVSQLHLLWQKVHNEAVKILVKLDVKINPENQYAFSKTFTTLLFQRVVVDEYLRTVLHPTVYELYFYNNNNFFHNGIKECSFSIPLEFSMAMFRFGHTMILGDYELKKGDTNTVSLGELLETGKKISVEHTIDWEKFFELDDTETQKAGTLDLTLTGILGGPASSAGRESFTISLDKSGGPDRLEQDNTAEKKIENGAKGLIMNDLMASRVVPTGGTLIDLLELAQEGSGEKPIHDLYNRLEISDGKMFRKIVNFERSILKDIKVRNCDCIQNMTIDTAPLWLFSLLESSFLPFQDRIAGFSEKFPRPKPDRLGPITSMVIAEVLCQSIRLAPQNIYQSVTEFSINMGPLSFIYSNIVSSPNGVTMADIFNFQNNY